MSGQNTAQNKSVRPKCCNRYLVVGDGRLVHIPNFIPASLSVYNVFDTRNVNDIYPLTGEPDDPGAYYRNSDIENVPRLGGEYSRSYYDRPWYYSSPRETNFFIRFDFN